MATFKRQTGSGWEHISLPVNIGMSPQTLGYAEVTANQNGIGAETDLTGLSVTVTVPAGRRIRLSAIGIVQLVTTAGRVVGRFREGATEIGRWTTEWMDDLSEYSTPSGSVVISPSAGTHTYRLTLQKETGANTVNLVANTAYPAYILVEDITGSTLPYQPASVPVGQLAYAQVTASQGTFTAETDLTGLSVNITVPAGRVLRVSGHCEISSSVSDGTMRLSIFEGATLLNMDEQNGTINAQGLNASAVISPSAGSHTYKLSGLRSAGTGNLTMAAGATFPAYILVEDITPTPAPSSGAPGSTLAYSEIVASQPPYTALTDIAGLSATITVPAGRRIRISGKALFQFSTTGDLGDLSIYEGGTRLNVSRITGQPGAKNLAVAVETVITPSAGTHTYKLATVIETGVGTITVTATASAPAFLLVEDITGSVWPTGSAVTAGMVASEEWIPWTPAFTNFTLGNGTLVAKYTRIGRTIHWRLSVTLGSTSVMGTNPLFTMPVIAAPDYVLTVDTFGMAKIYDFGTADYISQIWLNTTSQGRLVVQSGATEGTYNQVSAAVPMTWAVNDAFSASGTYEAAA